MVLLQTHCQLYTYVCICMGLCAVLPAGEQRSSSTAAGGQGGAPAAPAADGPDWVRRGHRTVSRLSLNAVAVSSDGALLAVGGGDRKVYAFDARSGAFLQAFPGHRCGGEGGWHR
jgi:WD40 repeat protein